MAGEYVCTLDAASLKKAKDELNEDPADRMAAVESFRELIRTRAPHVVCDMETEFLLRFLRTAKFSQLEALKRLTKYLEMFDMRPEALRDIDMMEPKVQEFLDMGYMLPLGYDKQGRVVIMTDEGAFDPHAKGFSKKGLMKGMFGAMLYYSNLEDERAVVNGTTGIADLSNFQLKHQTFWDMDDMKLFSHLMNGSWPIRWKSWTFYNAGPIFEVLWNLFRPFLKKKMKDRVNMAGSNLEAIYGKVVEKHMLPVEYLPDDYTGPNAGHVKDIIAKMKKELSQPEVVAKIKYATSSVFRIDESKRPKDDVPMQSFRKLNVD